MAVLDSVFPASGSPHYIYVASGQGRRKMESKRAIRTGSPTHVLCHARVGWYTSRVMKLPSMPARQQCPHSLFDGWRCSTQAAEV